MNWVQNVLKKKRSDARVGTNRQQWREEKASDAIVWQINGRLRPDLRLGFTQSYNESNSLDIVYSDKKSNA